MIDPTHKLPISKQAATLSISRGSVYYLPRMAPAAELKVMRRIDELHLDYPFAGSWMLQAFLAREGFDVGRLHVATLMKRMGITAIYRRPNTSKSTPGHEIYPYLLRKIAVTQPNQVWALDLNYVPMARGFVYLAALVDWFSRKILAWKLSITLDTAFCIEAVEEALHNSGWNCVGRTDDLSEDILPGEDMAFLAKGLLGFGLITNSRRRLRYGLQPGSGLPGDRTGLRSA